MSGVFSDVCDLFAGLYRGFQFERNHRGDLYTTTST